MRTDRLRGQVSSTCGGRGRLKRHWKLRRWFPPSANSLSLVPCTLLALQAWIVFSDISAATAALRGMQDFPFFEKPMVRLLPPTQGAAFVHRFPAILPSTFHANCGRQQKHLLTHECHSMPFPSCYGAAGQFCQVCLKCGVQEEGRQGSKGQASQGPWGSSRWRRSSKSQAAWRRSSSSSSRGQAASGGGGCGAAQPPAVCGGLAVSYHCSHAGDVVPAIPWWVLARPGDALRRKNRTLLEGMFVCSASPLVLRLF